jgi:hypothetical protein
MNNTPELIYIAPWTPAPLRPRAHYASAIPEEIWTRYRHTIIEMYIQLDWTLDDVMQAMQTYDFHAT